MPLMVAATSVSLKRWSGGETLVSAQYTHESHEASGSGLTQYLATALFGPKAPAPRSPCYSRACTVPQNMLLRPTAENRVKALTTCSSFSSICRLLHGWLFCGDFSDSRNTSLFRCRFDRHGRFRQPAQLDLALVGRFAR
ncbi:predicted protein [Micromonas commoda]|uniref:Uncharacterized protein n=1 Tax=Micromonas commoda (strain RCC299 / NOUM17 / CCMP2709) TaxID=296587 RepID=C1E8I7_MICCC|nr:predicted protein [Micromonas commoda]ACO64520.1 predicted protein [Micromonas commoda]|eukprot:XP_002503262.1 predicted protein [Micromonas commoda]